MENNSSPADQKDFLPTASWDNLRLRANLLRRLRKFFEKRDFLEVDTPVLSADTVIDRHLDPLSVTLFADPCTPEVGRRLWLQTSPEFGMKRLLAAGGTAIYQVTKAFRGAEIGDHHNPEFTMVEWYRVGDSYEAGMDLLADLAAAMLDGVLPGRLSYADAFRHYVGVDPHRAEPESLMRICSQQKLNPPASLDMNDRDQWLNFLLATCIEPNLGQEVPTILYDYPASQAALARVREGEPPCAERFELYVRGIELANGYHELLDPAVLRLRNQVTNSHRVAEGKPALPESSRLLTAMEHGLPDCTGVALGFDRLVMIAAAASSIADVMAFPVDRA